MTNKEKHICEDCIHIEICEWAVSQEAFVCDSFIDKKIIERPQGEWIDKGLYYECSICHGGYMRSINEKCLDLVPFNYCPICGSDNRVRLL